MMRILDRWNAGVALVGCVTLMALVGLQALAATPFPPPPPPAEEIQKITEAAPDKPTAVPEKPRKVLIFYLCEGSVHASVAYANVALEKMGEKTGAYSSVLSYDMSVFDAENLKQFDAIIFNSTTRLKFENQAYRKALIDFAKSGKGIVGIHAASDNFYDFPEAAEMIGGLFDGHPWKGWGTWAVKLDEPDHPLNKAFGGKGFTLSDEIYQMKEPYSREKLRVLVSLDMSNPLNDKVKAEEIHRTDKDNALVWVHRYGKGRVFYSAFGHNPPLFWDPKLLRHYLDGIQYALGDLKIDDTPVAQLEKKPVPVLSEKSPAESK